MHRRLSDQKLRNKIASAFGAQTATDIFMPKLIAVLKDIGMPRSMVYWAQPFKSHTRYPNHIMIKAQVTKGLQSSVVRTVRVDVGINILEFTEVETYNEDNSLAVNPPDPRAEMGDFLDEERQECRGFRG